MRFLKFITGCVFAGALFVGCSNGDTTAGIEIGNPEIANKESLALKADFSIDYVEVNYAPKPKSKALVRVSPFAKEAAKDEPVLIDTLNLTITEVRSFCSFYVGVSVLPAQGLIVWPYEDNLSAVLPVSFVNGSLIDETFRNIDLQADGRLKEIGVSFQVNDHKNPSIYGRALIGKKYVPFVYELSDFQLFTLRYHYSQIDVRNRTATLSVKFRARYFADGVDFSELDVDEDGVIRITRDNNVSTWNELNKKFVPSFQALRYEYVDARGYSFSDYVDDILLDVAGKTTKNVVTNANFADSTKDWILLNQLRGAADTTYTVNKDSSRTIEVNVTAGGQYSYSVQLMHENIPLVEGRKYRCSFTIKASEKGQITARIGSYLTYETIGFQEHVEVDTTEREFMVEFTPEVSDPFARFELNLGGSVRKLWIKNVEIVRLD